MQDVPTFRHYKNLVLHKAYADFRAEAERTYLGVAWWVLEPLIDMLIYYLVFAVFLRRGEEDFVPFLLTGLVAWRFFSVAVLRASNSILNNANMVRQIAFKKIMFPIVAILTCTFEFIFSLLLLFLFLTIYGYRLSIHFIAFPLVLVVELLLVLALAFPLSALVPFFPDLSKLLAYGMRIMFFMSGIVFSVSRLPSEARFVLQFNPALTIIDSFRDVLMYQRWPQWQHLGIVFAISLLSIFFGIRLISRFDPLFAKRISR